MGNAFVKCVQCRPESRELVPDQDTRDTIEAYVAAYVAKKKEAETMKNMKKIMKVCKR